MIRVHAVHTFKITADHEAKPVCGKFDGWEWTGQWQAYSKTCGRGARVSSAVLLQKRIVHCVDGIEVACSSSAWYVHGDWREDSFLTHIPQNTTKRIGLICFEIIGGMFGKRSLKVDAEAPATKKEHLRPPPQIEVFL